MRTPRRSLYLRTLAAALGAVALGEMPCTALADIPAVAQRQRTEKKTFTDSEIVDGFLKTAFGAEYHLAGRVDRIRKYDGPVRVFADGNRGDRKAQLAKIVADIAARVQHLDIAMAETIEDANVQVKLFARPAMPVGLSQEREVRNRAFRCDPHRRQWRLRLLRLRL